MTDLLSYEKISDNLRKHYNIDDILNISNCNAGHINSTYIVDCATEKYIFQRINTSVFHDPIALMENISNVSEHIRGKVESRGGDTRREVLNIVKTVDGNTFFSSDGNFYRMYLFIKDATSYQLPPSLKVFYNSAKAFGSFQRDLLDFDTNRLHETIPHFHDTVSRFSDFCRSVDSDRASRKATVTSEVDFVMSRESKCSYITSGLESGKFMWRVTHNDTKLNNIMIDDATQEGICVIDLDTVMPGSSLYDFGDAVRFGASSAAEDEKDLSRVQMRLDLFETYASGYLEGLGDAITDEEANVLPMGAYLMTLECGMRFLTDYLNGDVYFHTDYESHNLDRARTQFKLVLDIESKLAEMQKIINNIRRR